MPSSLKDPTGSSACETALRERGGAASFGDSRVTAMCLQFRANMQVLREQSSFTLPELLLKRLH